jgi:hypothetical protein
MVNKFRNLPFSLSLPPFPYPSQRDIWEISTQLPHLSATQEEEEEKKKRLLTKVSPANM